MTRIDILERQGWTPDRIREFIRHIAKTPEQARHLEQRVRQIAARKAERRSRQRALD